MPNSDEPTSPRFPLAPYPPSLERLRSRAPEFYGFAALTSTYFLFVLYIFWALLPDALILRLGIEWYPSREWAILLPAYSVVLIMLTYFTYWALALYNTPKFNELCTIIDTRAYVPVLAVDAVSSTASTTVPVSCPKSSPSRPDSAYSNPFLAGAAPDAIPIMYDFPLGFVNRVLYDQRPRRRQT